MSKMTRSRLSLFRRALHFLMFLKVLYSRSLLGFHVLNSVTRSYHDFPKRRLVTFIIGVSNFGLSFVRYITIAEMVAPYWHGKRFRRLIRMTILGVHFRTIYHNTFINRVDYNIWLIRNGIFFSAKRF